MSMHRNAAALTLCAAGLVAAALGRAGAQDAPKPVKGYASLEDLHASYDKQMVELDRRRVADLTALAAKASGEEAEAAYRELFGIAVARDLYAEAEAAAQHYLKAESADPAERSMATLVALIAKANRGEYDQSLDDLMAAIKKRQVAADPAKPVDPSVSIALGEAYLQRLLRGGRYDIAQKACKLAIANVKDASVQAHFRARLARLEMLGKAAPEIVGKDVDGKAVKLSDLKGKVVLIDFWATWCPPCVAGFPELKAVDSKYASKGFVILGVNLDAQRQDVGDVAKAAPVVRQFLLNGRAAWPNILVGPSTPNDPAATYGIDEIPANFLVDRSGKIVHFELSGLDLDQAVAKAVAGK